MQLFKQTMVSPRCCSRGGLNQVLTIILVTLLLAANAPLAQAASDQEAILRQARQLIDHRDKQSLLEAISLLDGHSQQLPGEIRFPLYLAEAYYLQADPAAEVSREYVYYERAGKYAEEALAIDPNRPEAHYWHGLYLLKQAQKRGLMGYSVVKEGIKELEQVRRTMPAYDHGGASRVLGLLYCLAPGWSPFGDLSKAIELGLEATRIAPDYALNRIYLAQAYQKRGDKTEARQECQAILALKNSGPQANEFAAKARDLLHVLEQES
jgi:hypothetical protein